MISDCYIVKNCHDIVLVNNEFHSLVLKQRDWIFYSIEKVHADCTKLKCKSKNKQQKIPNRDKFRLDKVLRC